MCSTVVYPLPGQDGYPAERPATMSPRPPQRRSPAEWREVFRPFSDLWALPFHDLDEVARDLPPDFWAAVEAWWAGACAPLDVPRPDVRRADDLDARARERRPVETDNEPDPEAAPVAPRVTLDDLAEVDDADPTTWPHNGPAKA